jgi:hypothetical protein
MDETTKTWPATKRTTAASLKAGWARISRWGCSWSDWW